ncbi:MAG TPA: flagellar biosynthetic protein FliR, partial [Blastocatellia bacterium]|nr:flagellar biosynthetic protein FliR [Blastocatellia bacterium]
TIPLQPVLLFVIVLARVGGLVTFAPFWSHNAVNARTRALIAGILALVIAPIVAPRLSAPPTNLIALTMVIGGELAIGCALGFAARLVFSALEIAAQIFGFQIGLSLASVIDPATRAQTAALGIIAQMLGLMVMLASDGHHWLLRATVQSYWVVGSGGFTASATLIEILLRLSANALAVGVAIAAPAIIVLLGLEVLLGVMGRAAPKLELMVMSFPIKIAVGMWLMGGALYFIPGSIRQTLDVMRQAITALLKAM